MTAMLYPSADITAIDLSLASLSYAKDKAQALGLSNIEFYQADILNLDQLDQTFDVIECSGVLHHMDDSVKGWRCLLEKLVPSGRMHIGLYSEIARKDVVAARAYIAEKGFEPTHGGIRAARQAIIDLPDGHDARGVLSRRDFYSISGCRDLIFHVQEHRFTIQKLHEALDSLGLDFQGFDLESAETRTAYKKAFPEDPKMLNLDNWAGFEEQNPDTFRGMYQFWCQPKISA